MSSVGPYITLGLFIILCYVVYKYLTRNYDYWAAQSVPFVTPYVFVGSLQFNEELHVSEQRLYKKYGRLYGRFDGSAAVLTVADPVLLKSVLIQNFDVFPNHRDLRCNDSVMDQALFILRGKSWKRVRNIVSPIFTSAKLRKMTPILQECTDDVLAACKSAAERNVPMACSTTMKRFTLSAIARCIFGVRMTFQVEAALLYYSERAFLCTFSWRTFCILLCPSLMRMFRISLMNPEAMQFYTTFMKQVVETARSKKKEENTDFLQRILAAEERGKISGRVNQETGETIENRCPIDGGLSKDEALAQCVNFFMAGLDPTASLLCSAIHYLAQNEEYQERLLREIENAMEENQNALKYDAVMQLKFLNAIICETLRLCPSLIRAERRAESDFVLDGIMIKKGMLISIPVYAMHRDPEFFPDPETFLPDRFLLPEILPPQLAFLPFGAGQRLCLGKRFVELAVKLCLARIVLNYRIEPPEKKKVPLELQELRGILKVKEVEVKFVARS